MPLPRFERLPAATRASILAVARAHFARDGRDGASYNQIIAGAGISKTSAYHYFDGKQDLFDAVAADCLARAAGALGEWIPAEDPASFWTQVRSGSAGLLAHFAVHPDDRTVLAMVSRGGEPPQWTWSMLDDAIRLGLVDERERTIVGVATQGVLDAVDAYALRHPEEGERMSEALPDLLARLWSRRGGDITS